MRRFPVLLFISLLFISSCGLFFDECRWDPVTTMFTGSGPSIENPVFLESNGTYTYDIFHFAYVADLEGGGYMGCPQRDKRLPDVDSLIVSNPSIANVEITGESLLKIHAVSSGSTNVSIYLSATVGDEPTHPVQRQLTTEVIVE